ncbi:MAG TPA: carbohydrate-binding family 9-like protein [Pyrinomonadaceae bacterium]|nr:carbohydrate-binding family 9-like protein [Pyrinomonadaceae bacterium]
MSNRPEKTIEALYSANDLAVSEFDHPAWTSVQPTRITKHWSGPETPDSRHAEARIVWTDESLVVRFVCRQVEPPIVSPTPDLTHKTIGLWERDVCEIFLAPDTSTPNRYFEFEAAPTGEWLDLAIDLGPAERQTDWGFQSGMTTASCIRGTELVISMRIPWSEAIHRPQRGDEWRVNLFRCIGTGDERYLAWQPTYTPEPNFHVPEAFGWLRFA